MKEFNPRPLKGGWGKFQLMNAKKLSVIEIFIIKVISIFPLWGVRG